MTCREAAILLSRFVDGELDSRQMRAVALHSACCGVCETEVRQLERIQQLLSDSVNATLDTVDFGDFWQRVERRMVTTRVSPWQRVLVWWSQVDRGWAIRIPAYATAAAVAVTAAMYGVRFLEPYASTVPTAIADLSTQALIHKLEADVEAVTVINDADTTVLWVSDELSGAGE